MFPPSLLQIASCRRWTLSVQYTNKLTNLILLKSASRYSAKGKRTVGCWHAVKVLLCSEDTSVCSLVSGCCPPVVKFKHDSFFLKKTIFLLFLCGSQASCVPQHWDTTYMNISSWKWYCFIITSKTKVLLISTIKKQSVPLCERRLFINTSTKYKVKALAVYWLTDMICNQVELFDLNKYTHQTLYLFHISPDTSLILKRDDLRFLTWPIILPEAAWVHCGHKEMALVSNSLHALCLNDPQLVLRGPKCDKKYPPQHYNNSSSLNKDKRQDGWLLCCYCKILSQTFKCHCRNEGKETIFFFPVLVTLCNL